MRRACTFLIGKQQADGGWGESYKVRRGLLTQSCETGTYTHAPKSQVVQTAWVVIALLHAKYPDKAPIERGVRLIMDRQQPNGSWKQEQIEGIFNQYVSRTHTATVCTSSTHAGAISYPNYKFSFTIWALGKAARELGS